MAERKYLRHQSYPQGLNQAEQNEAEKGIPYSNSWSASDLRRGKGFNTIGHYRSSSAKAMEKNQTFSLCNNMNIESSSAGNLHSSHPATIESVDSMAGAIATLPRPKLQSVDEGTEHYDPQYPTTRQERLDSLRKSKPYTLLYLMYKLT